MKTSKTHLKKTLVTLFTLIVMTVGMTKMYAYDFSAVCETGQTLYYNITNATNHYVALTYPGNSSSSPWEGFTKPTGNIILPETIQYNSVTYVVTSISVGAFSNCSDLTGSLTIPSSVTTIGNIAFQYCTGFTGNLTIPNSVTTIGGWAFMGCSGLTGSLTIPNSVTMIGHFAFSSCSGLTGNLIIPTSTVSIETNPFTGCSGLEHIEVASGNPVYDSRNNCNAIIKTNTNELVSGCMNSSIPNSVTTIGRYAFASCGLTGSLTIPNSVITIGELAFSHCIGLTSLTIGNSVTTIDERAFYHCNGLTGNLTIPNSVTTIGQWAFYHCNGLTSLTIGNSVTTIVAGAFEGCSGLTSLTLGNSVTTIGNQVFFGCSGMTSIIVLAETPPSVGAFVFNHVPKNIPVYVPIGTIGAYQNADGWNEFTNYQEISGSHTVLATCNPIEGGTVTGTGTFATGETCILTATANNGYSFANWTENGIVVSTENPYSFIVMEDASYVANFELSNPTDYISDGLIMYLDGINNTRNGHSTTTDVWEDLMGNYDLTVTDYGSYVWEDNHFFGAGNYGYLNTGKTWQYFNSLNDDITIEIVTYIDCDKTSPAWRGLAGWHINSDGTNFQNDQGGGRMETLGVLPVSEADNQIATVSYTRYNGSFLNGIWKTETNNIQYGINSSQEVIFGNSHYWGRGWNDSIYCIRMYNRTLTPEEIAYNHNIDVVRFGAGNGGTFPLGEFTYMTPTNNYPFTSFPIEFSWDAVENAQHYDLYLWNANDPMPEEPYVSGLTNGFYRCTSLPNHQTYQWYVKAYNPYNAITSNIRAFTVDVEPAINVSMNSIDFGEVVLNHTASTSLSIEGIALENDIQIQLIGEDASMFSFTTTSGWNDYSGGSLLVNFTPTISQYEFHATLAISCDDLTQTIVLSGSVADIYVFNTYVDENVYAMNSSIPIHGTVTDNQNNPAANVDVEIGVFVMGMKRSLQATTDENGAFSAIFEPIASESGYYTVNSGRMGNNSTAVHDDFNIPGMSVIADGYILCAVTQNQPKTDTIRLRNKSNLPLNNIQISVLSAPDGCSFSFSPLSLAGLEEGYLIYTVTGSTLTQGNYYEEVKLKATTNEGSETAITIWYYCMEARGVLDVSPKTLTTTMTKGKSKIVDVMLSNNGTAATGNIFIDLPDVEWMSIVGNDTLPSLSVNDTAYFSLRFSPNNDIPLMQYSGNIAVNCEHGEFANLPFAITAVSDSTGTFVVDITDDYTWNTNNGNGPHLGGAEVTLKGYYSLETVAQGYTDANGIFQVENLPEGYYRLHVEAANHKQYDSNILITAGETNNRNIYLQYQGVSYSWTVEPTEIPDEYTIELNVVYETNVPAPVVTIDISSQVPELEYGESHTFNAIVTNHGLIAAKDFQLIVPELNEYIFYPLYDFIDSLPAQTTVVIPITVHRVQPARYGYYTREDDPCWARLGAMMYYVCGRDYEHNSDRYVWHHAYSREVFINTCVLNALANQLPDLPCFGCGGGSGSGSGSGGGIIEDFPPESHYEVGCHPCDELLKDVIWSLPLLSDFNYTTGFIGGNSHSAYDHIVQWGSKLPYVGWAVQAGFFAGNLAAYLQCQWEYTFGSRNQSLNLDDFDYVFRLNDDIIEIYHEFYLDSLLYEKQGFELLNSLMMPYYSDMVEISGNDAETIKSSLNSYDISVASIDDIINRWNQTVVAWNDNVFEPNINYPNIINKVHLDNIGSDIDELCEHVISLGYDSFYAMIEDLYGILDEEINKMSNSVCSHVTVQFSQKMTMTREAFEGTFNVHNGHDLNAMEGIGLNFVVKDENGSDCTNLFQINTTSLTNLTAIDGSGSLGAGMDGTAKILFIPTKQAAPIESKVYYFGGTFSFIDPYTSEEFEYELYPVDLTVHPSPDLYVDYFMQRDILGDDALTLDKVEPSIPAELGVIINNKGAGVAKNVILETAEPKIIDNDKGLAIDFAMYGASFNGNEAQLGLMSIPFGNIDSGHTAVGEWLFTSSLLGHFVSYEAHVIHNNSYGNPNLSLVSHLDIHELIHPIRAYGNLDDGINDFLVNDVPDFHDYPDSIYFSNGGKTGVSLFNNINFNHYVQPNDTIVTLTVNPSSIGWNYGLTDDPGTDKYELVSCTRNIDNQIIPLNNIWQTFVTLQNQNDPIYENKLHIVDTLSNDNQNYTYTLVYSLKKSLLAVEEIIGIPNDFIEYPLESFSVKFNRPIADSTFTYEDMTLKCNNGSNLMNSSVIITKLDDDLYNVNISGLTLATGYYVLNIHTLNINDTQGYNGYDGKQASWIQVLDGANFVYINENQTICENDTFKPLTSIVIGASTSLQWKRDGTPIAGANSSTYQPVEAGIYTLSVTFENGEVLTSNEVSLTTHPSHQTLITEYICEGEDYTLNGFNLTNLPFGIYDETLYYQNEYGCDSIVSLHLTVHESINVHIIGDTIVEAGQSITLFATGAEFYEWSTGETTASITISPTETTTYSVVGTNGHGCSDSEAITVTVGHGIHEESLQSTQIYPNPVRDKLFIHSEQPIDLVEVYSLTGTLLYRYNSCDTIMEIPTQNFCSGMYFIRLITGTSVETKTFVKE